MSEPKCKDCKRYLIDVAQDNNMTDSDGFPIGEKVFKAEQSNQCVECFDARPK
jgi:hypothetical protein